MRRILTIDGGGIRGVSTAMVLENLETVTGKRVREIFDFIAGTSTGALIAAAAAAGIPARDIVGIYVDRGGEIFTPGPPLATVRRLANGWMYHTTNIHRVMDSVLGAAAKWTLNDAPVKLLITAVGIDRHRWFFVPDSRKNARTTGHFPLIDCAVASAAAPTYFYPWHVPGLGPCVDGGVGTAGNPLYQACVEAFQYDDFDPADTVVVSLGTGQYGGPRPVPSGFVDWLDWTVGTLLDAPMQEQHELVLRHYPQILPRFTRYNWVLPRPIDMADVSAVPELVQVGRSAAATVKWPSML